MHRHLTGDFSPYVGLSEMEMHATCSPDTEHELIFSGPGDRAQQ